MFSPCAKPLTVSKTDPRLRGDDVAIWWIAESHSCEDRSHFLAVIPAKAGIHDFLRPLLPALYPKLRSEPCCPVRARLVDCLTEPGIVRFPVALRRARRLWFGEATGKRYEAREGVSTCLARTGQQGGRTSANISPCATRQALFASNSKSGRAHFLINQPRLPATGQSPNPTGYISHLTARFPIR